MENTVLCNMQSIQFQFITVQEKVPKSSLGLFAPPGGRYFCQPNVRAACPCKGTVTALVRARFSEVLGRGKDGFQVLTKLLLPAKL